MSTKIYYACRFPKSRINDFLDATREYALNKIYERISGLMKDLKPKVVAKFTDKYLKKIEKTKKDFDKKDWVGFEQTIRYTLVMKHCVLASQDTRRDALFCIDFAVNIWLDKRFAYAIPYGEYWLKADWLKSMPEWVKDYAYWNNTDRPDELSAAQWSARRKKWDELTGYGNASHNARRLFFDIMTAKDYVSQALLEEYWQKRTGHKKLYFAEWVLFGKLPSANMTQRKERLETVLNNLLKIKQLTYSDLNKVIPYGDLVCELRALEKKYPELGIARYGTPEEGISFKSLISTITDVLCGDRLAFVLPDPVDTPEEAKNLPICDVAWLSDLPEDTEEE